MEGASQVHDPLIFGVCQNVLLLAGLDDLVFVDHFAFDHLLNGDGLVRLLPAAESDLSKGTLTDYFQTLKVANVDFLAGNS